MMSANDVDLYPPLVYTFDLARSNKEAINLFEIDRYSGKIILKNYLDFENRHEYRLMINASDSKHIAKSTLTILVTDVNDNAPVFERLAYHISAPGIALRSLRS